MNPTEKPLIAFALFKKPPFIRVVKEPAQTEDAVPCRVCCRKLRAEASIAAGIGPVCSKKDKAKEKRPKTTRKVSVAEARQPEPDNGDPAAKGKPDSWQVYLERNADFLRGR